MDRSRWVSLGVVVVYVAVCALVLVWSDGRSPPRVEGFQAERIGFVLLFLGFASIWWSEALGGALWTGRGVWNAKPSSEGAVTLLGWVFMALAVAVPVIDRLQGD